MANVKLGDRVRDPLTGIRGIAYCRYTYLQGCDRIGIQQPIIRRPLKVPIIPELWVVDEPQLKIVKRKVMECQVKEDDPTGGPSGYEPDGKR